MNTISVHSSFIKSAVYNEDKEFLRIEIGNAWYYYYGVTKQKVARFKKAASKGQYFCRYIKGQYRMIKRQSAGSVRVNNNNNKTKMEKRTFSEIALEIKSLWRKPYFGAVPYIDALRQIHSSDKNARYLFETAEDLVPYLLSNMASFRGEDAKRIKAELKEMIK